MVGATKLAAMIVGVIHIVTVVLGIIAAGIVADMRLESSQLVELMTGGIVTLLMIAGIAAVGLIGVALFSDD